MAAKRQTTYFNDRTLMLLADVFSNGSVSSRINTIVDRYYETIARTVAQLNDLFGAEEMDIIRAAVVPSWSRTDRSAALLSDLPTYTAARLAQLATQQPGLRAATEAIRKKLPSLGAAQWLAIIEIIEVDHKEKKGVAE